MKETLPRIRLLLFAAAAALGGALGKAGHASPVWVIIPAIAVCLFVVYARSRGWRAAWSLVCLAFFCAGLCLGHSSFASWRGRGGPAGDVLLAGIVEVGCRGERGDVVELFRVTEVVGGEGARAGDRYLIRHRDQDGVPLLWGKQLR